MVPMKKFKIFFGEKHYGTHLWQLKFKELKGT